MDAKNRKNNQLFFEFTPAGEQAIQLLQHSPDYLKFLPYFIIEILLRYKQDNPAQTRRNAEETNIFPYRTFFAILRKCDNYITEDEFQRFLVKLTDQEQLPETINTINKYREDLKSGKQNPSLISSMEVLSMKPRHALYTLCIAPGNLLIKLAILHKG